MRVFLMYCFPILTASASATAAMLGTASADSDDADVGRLQGM